MKFWLAVVVMLSLSLGSAHAQSVIDDQMDLTVAGEDNPNSTQIAGGDTLRTGAVEAYGARCVVFAIKATTGKDSAIVVQVSQDGTKYFTAAQDGATNNVVLSGYAGGDSLRNGPHTCVVSFVDSKGNLPIPYRYVRLKIFNTNVTPITGLSVDGNRIWIDGRGEAYTQAYAPGNIP